MDWNTAVLNAIKRECERTNKKIFRRDMLIFHELDNIVKDTQSKGATPEYTLSRVLQILRDKNIIKFIDNKGTYQLLT